VPAAGAGIAGIGDEWGMVPLNCATVAPLDITTTAAAATTVLAILSMPVSPSWAQCRVMAHIPPRDPTLASVCGFMLAACTERHVIVENAVE
jgi:hypothetical protein